MAKEIMDSIVAMKHSTPFNDDQIAGMLMFMHSTTIYYAVSLINKYNRGETA